MLEKDILKLLEAALSSHSDHRLKVFNLGILHPFKIIYLHYSSVKSEVKYITLEHVACYKKYL